MRWIAILQVSCGTAGCLAGRELKGNNSSALALHPYNNIGWKLAASPAGRPAGCARRQAPRAASTLIWEQLRAWYVPHGFAVAHLQASDMRITCQGRSRPAPGVTSTRICRIRGMPRCLLPKFMLQVPEQDTCHSTGKYNFSQETQHCNRQHGDRKNK
jgi:hypothetical protein